MKTQTLKFIIMGIMLCFLVGFFITNNEIFVMIPVICTMGIMLYAFFADGWNVEIK